ncbi:MAG TPA: APC family permease [Burkholderiales bacterium]|nr:APC family permease [Burkholderiales bacterium]
MDRDADSVAQAGAAPKPLLSVPDGIVLLCGMVIGVGIFKAPSVVAGATSSAAEFLGAWLLGGLVSLCGALVYAELAARHPDTGGEYAYLSRGLGRGVAFVFAWSRITVIQTGAIALVAFVFGDYASELLRLGAHSSAIYAAIGVVALTALNVAGTLQSKTLQKVLQTLLFVGLIVIGVAGLASGGVPKPTESGGGGAFGLAMIFVLLTYGGWNEAAYLAGEVREARRNMTRILVWGIVVISLLYLFVNLGYLAALGQDGMRGSKVVAADVVRVAVGERGAILLALIVCVAALTTMNAAIFTGARTTWALGRDFALFARLGHWRDAGSTPANALVLQGAIALVLVAASASTPDGFSAMVAYTSPVFWTFFLLTALTLFVFRLRGGAAPAFRVPLYPLIPLAFCAACLFMLYSAIDYVRNPDYGPKFGDMVLGGLIVMLAGIPLYFLVRRRRA